VSVILSSAPLDLVDLLFDFKRFEVVELRLMRLEFCVELVFAASFLSIAWRNQAGNVDRYDVNETHRLVALKENDTATFVAGGEVIACGIELDCGYDVGCGVPSMRVS
jgi:hypothetical protein